MSRPLIVSKNLDEFFRAEVSEARAHLGMGLSEVLEHYLVNLLCTFSRQDSGPRPGEEPLALLYKRALDSGVAQRVQLLKDLGDVALYVSGFFAAFVERSMIDLGYYISMGGAAYRDLSALVGGKRQGEMFADLYQDLAGKFGELVDLLNEVSERGRTSPFDATQLVRLYDRFLRTGSQRARKMLVEQGLMPHRPTEFTH